MTARRHASRSSKHHSHLSQMLQELLDEDDSTPLTVGALVDHFEDRGLATTLAVLALPIALPIPMPGISAIFGLPMLVIALQITARKKRLWLPEGLRKRDMNRERFKKIATAAIRWMKRIEFFLKPRWVWLCHPVLQSFYGLICAWLALMLILPIPFGNVLPSLSISVLALALLERDGIAVIVGLILSCVSIVLTAGAMVAVIRTLL
jgi:hypothetical protein